MGEGKLHVSIPSWEVEDRHVVFNISIMPAEGETYGTKRRYREFERLNRKLEAKSMPKINLPGKLFVHSDSAIEGRRVKLERALKSYVQFHGLNTLLEDFLAPRSDVYLHGSRKSSMQDSIMDESVISVTRGQEPIPDAVGSLDDDEALSKMPVVESVYEGDSASGSDKHYQTWALEMLAARASFRAERGLSLRLARIYTLATVATLLGSMSLKSNRWPLIGAALGSAVSAGFALLNALYLSKKEDWRRRGFGLQESAARTTDSKDVKQLMDHLEQKRVQKKAQATSGADKQDSEEEQIQAESSEDEQLGRASTKVAQEIDEILLGKLDDMHQNGLHDDVIMVLRTFDDLCDSRLAWRWARAVYYQSLGLPDATLAGDQLEAALQTLRTSANREASSLTHKWIAIVHNAYGDRRGAIRDKVEAGLSFEFHTKRALEIDPEDPTLHYMSGRFCFDVSGLSWFERQAARAISGKEPPKATYEEALKHYENAMALKASPAFLLEIGRCHQKLKNDAKAVECLKHAAEFVPQGDDKLTVEEDAAIVEAKELLRKLNV